MNGKGLGQGPEVREDRPGVGFTLGTLYCGVGVSKRTHLSGVGVRFYFSERMKIFGSTLGDKVSVHWGTGVLGHDSRSQSRRDPPGSLGQETETL